MKRDGGQHSNNAERINSKQTAYVEIANEWPPFQVTPFHRVHQDQTRVNEKEQNPECSDRRDRKAQLCFHSAPIQKMLGKHQQHRQGSQKIQICGRFGLHRHRVRKFRNQPTQSRQRLAIAPWLDCRAVVAFRATDFCPTALSLVTLSFRFGIPFAFIAFFCATSSHLQPAKAYSSKYLRERKLTVTGNREFAGATCMLFIHQRIQSFLELGTCKEYPTMAKPRNPKKNIENSGAVSAASAPAPALNPEAKPAETASNAPLPGAGVTKAEAKKPEAISRATTRKPEIVRANVVPINLDDEIRQLAYLFSERRGFEPGHETEDWLAAEHEVRQRYRQQSA